MTLTEVDSLRRDDPERFYRFFFFIQERLKKEQKELSKLGKGGSGESDTFTMKPKEE